MERAEANVLLSLVAKNIPFVVYRAPGEEKRLIIQLSPISKTPIKEISKRGFYAFPFSEEEPVDPIYLNPDYDLKFEKNCLESIDLPILSTTSSTPVNYYEVDKEEYLEDIEHFLKTFEKEDISKAIYSRVREEELDYSLDLDRFFNMLCEQYKKAFTYVMNIPGDGIWVGASPELLLAYDSGKAQTVALAGTLKINPQSAAPEWTRKEIDEHRMVEKYIAELCKNMDLEYDKSPVRTTNTGKVYHLKSEFNIEIETNQVADFLKKLHPTPAISGLPKEKALDLIKRTEKHDRTYYCGFLGYVSDPSDFDFYINLRCMKVVKDRCFLFAGGGITKDSVSSAEWEETNVKMSTLSDLLETNVDHEKISSVSC